MKNTSSNNYNLYERNLERYIQKNISIYQGKSQLSKWIIFYLVKINKLFLHKLYINYIEMPITTKCSLRCKECANLIQYYDKGSFYNYRMLLSDIYKLCQIVEGIEMLRILGGEPLMHPYLKELIMGMLKYEKVKNIQIVTNGTMLFKDDILKVLRNKRISVDISNYGSISRNYDNLIRQLRNNNIKFCTNKELKWTPQGDFSCRNRSQKELKKIFKNCRSDCISLLEGELHLCPRSSNGSDLHIFEADLSDYVNLRNYKSKRKVRELLFNLLNNKSIIACNYCDYFMRDQLKSCIAGEQISKKEALERYYTTIDIKGEY